MDLLPGQERALPGCQLLGVWSWGVLAWAGGTDQRRLWFHHTVLLGLLQSPPLERGVDSRVQGPAEHLRRLESALEKLCLGSVLLGVQRWYNRALP